MNNTWHCLICSWSPCHNTRIQDTISSTLIRLSAVHIVFAWRKVEKATKKKKKKKHTSRGRKKGNVKAIGIGITVISIVSYVGHVGLYHIETILLTNTGDMWLDKVVFTACMWKDIDKSVFWYVSFSFVACLFLSLSPSHLSLNHLFYLCV